ETKTIDALRETNIVIQFEMHYKGHTHEILVEAVSERNGTITEEDMQRTLYRFHDIHEQMYTIKKPEEEIEILGVQVDIWGIRGKPSLQKLAVQDPDSIDILVGHRGVYFEDYKDFVNTPVYDGL